MRWRSQRPHRWAALAFLAGAMFAGPGAAGADVIPPGQKPVTYCYEVVNAGEFAAYVLLAFEQPRNPSAAGAFRVVADATCQSPAADTASYTFYAMERAGFSRDLLPTEHDAQRAFLASDPRLIRGAGAGPLSPVRFVDQGDPTTAIADSYRVASLTGSALAIEAAGRRATPGGAAASSGAGGTSVAPESRVATLAWFALLPLAALIAIGVILLVRRRGRAV